MVELVSPGAFQFRTPYQDIHALESKLIYFSMVTLSTVGYGDITPIHPVATRPRSIRSLNRSALSRHPDRPAGLHGIAISQTQEIITRGIVHQPL